MKTNVNSNRKTVIITLITTMAASILTGFDWHPSNRDNNLSQVYEESLEPSPTPADPLPTATLEPTISPSPEPSPILTVTYKELNTKIFTPLCVKCHGNGMRLAGVKLNTYSDAIKFAEGLRRSTLKSSMPPEGSGRRLTQDEGTLILDWLDQDLPE
jgi:hypothetical protein